MNRNLKTILYFIITILVLSLIFKLFIKILPFIVLLVLALWIISKVKGYINKKKDSDNTYTYQSYSNYSKTNEDDTFFEDEDEDPSKAIDVDYQEVNDNKK